MKHICKTAVALLAIAAMFFSLAACGNKKGEVDYALLQGIFEKLQANEEYASWKTMFSKTSFEEKLDGDTITISAQGEEYVNGDFNFTMEGDYIVAKAPASDFMTYTFMTFLKSAVADYYGMNDKLISGYLAGLEHLGKKNTFFISDVSKTKSVYKLYVAGAWDMKGLDEMYVNDAAMEGIVALDEEETPFVFNSGKITVTTFGNVDNFELIVGEYGENTALSYRSIMTVVKALQPTGYEAFTDSFTELKEVSGDGYTVSFGISKETSENYAVNEEPGYSYVTIKFSSGSAVADASNTDA